MQLADRRTRATCFQNCSPSGCRSPTATAVACIITDTHTQTHIRSHMHAAHRLGHIIGPATFKRIPHGARRTYPVACMQHVRHSHPFRRSALAAAAAAAAAAAYAHSESTDYFHFLHRTARTSGARKIALRTKERALAHNISAHARLIVCMCNSYARVCAGAAAAAPRGARGRWVDRCAGPRQY